MLEVNNARVLDSRFMDEAVKMLASKCFWRFLWNSRSARIDGSIVHLHSAKLHKPENCLALPFMAETHVADSGTTNERWITLFAIGEMQVAVLKTYLALKLQANQGSKDSCKSRRHNPCLPQEAANPLLHLSSSVSIPHARRRGTAFSWVAALSEAGCL